MKFRPQKSVVEFPMKNEGFKSDSLSMLPASSSFQLKYASTVTGTLSKVDTPLFLVPESLCLYRTRSAEEFFSNLHAAEALHLA